MSVDERKLIGQVLAGRTEEFGYFLEKYGRQVLALVSRLVTQQMDAEEVVQDAFVNAFTHLDNYDSRSSFSTWICRIAYNCAIDRLRSMKRERTDDIDEMQLAEVSDSTADELMQTEDEDKIVYFLHHSELDTDGREKVKTIGKMLDEKLRMIFSGGDIVAPIAVPMYTVELTSIKEDAFALCGEPEVSGEIFYRSDEEACEHSFLNIEDRNMSFFYEYWDRKTEITTKALYLEDIDAVAVEKALGVDSYAGIIDSLTVYFGAADGVVRFADFLRSKSIDFVEKDR